MTVTKQRYTVVVESGSCSMDYKHWEERVTCGHKHKSLETALKCMRHLTRWYCQHGHVAGTPCAQCLGYSQAQETSATWYNATIHHADDETRLTDCESMELEAVEIALARERGW